ncbi:sugar phosphate isomerase/epimerase family protein [Urechidicola croceus]|uniref:Sugar phosphate isomerase n=1 Tax=Urechidicola croceus TaxID=1850246 RepID=A0A1D8P7B2_9FLAO|nr:sugar phosphate isomerase/epimerase [Urechidicola croceus]AOW20467.1 sugar phosphate isomerase [Urechidicola croceus]
MKKLIPILFVAALFIQCKTDKKTPETVQETEVKPLFTSEFGIAPYSFRRSFPNGIEATLDTIVGMGFTMIEGGGGDMDPAEYRKLCESKGLSIPSMGTGYNNLVENPQAIADKAKILGAKYVMCAWLPHERGNFTLENAQQTVKDFNAFGKVLADNGITFTYHTHGYEFQPYEDGTLMDYIIQNTNPEYVSFEMDILWTYFGGGDPAALLRKYPTRWKQMHVKDLKKGTVRDMTGLTHHNNDVEVGTGELDIPEILKAAKEIGIENYFIEDESDRIITQIPASIKYIKSLKE